MPANLTPEYKAVEAAFRKAHDPRERLEHLREMLRVIPKHKGTDHLQADIKRRIKELSEELEGPQKGGAARHGPAHVIRPEGAGQVMLVGPPNSGKSSLHARLTGSHAHVAPYPFTTLQPQPGMMPYEDIHFELVDLPAISRPCMPCCVRNASRSPSAGPLQRVPRAEQTMPTILSPCASRL
jgi:ribosome biogenesis GTPase A